MFKKILKIIKENFSEYNSWRLPDDKELSQEYHWEYEIRNIKNWNLFDSEKEFIKKAKEGKLIEIDKNFDDKIDYRSQTKSIESLKELVSHYKFPRDVDRIIKGFENNESMPVPIVLKFSRGYRIMSGNTRLDTAFILRVRPKVLIVDVRDRK